MPAALKVPDGDLAAELAAFMALYGAKTNFVLYPDKSEASDVALGRQHFAPGQALLQAAGATRLVDMQQDPRWGGGWYKDGIHPHGCGQPGAGPGRSDCPRWSDLYINRLALA